MKILLSPKQMSEQTPKESGHLGESLCASFLLSVHTHTGFSKVSICSGFPFSDSFACACSSMQRPKSAPLKLHVHPVGLQQNAGISDSSWLDWAHLSKLATGGHKRGLQSLDIFQLVCALSPISFTTHPLPWSPHTTDVPWLVLQPAKVAALDFSSIFL